MNTVKRHDWCDALVKAGNLGVLPEGAVNLCLRLATAILWEPNGKRKGQPSGLYWKNEEALKTVGSSKATYHRYRAILFETGFFQMQAGNLIPCIPDMSQIETVNASTKSQIETVESQIETEKSQIETPESQIEYPYSVDIYSEDSFSDDSYSEEAGSAGASPAVDSSDSKESLEDSNTTTAPFLGIPATRSVANSLGSGDSPESQSETDWAYRVADYVNESNKVARVQINANCVERAIELCADDDWNKRLTNERQRIKAALVASDSEALMAGSW